MDSTFGGRSDQNQTEKSAKNVAVIEQLLQDAEDEVQRWRLFAIQETRRGEPFKCWLGCGELLPTVDDMYLHTRTTCISRLLKCPRCGALLTKLDTESHMKDQCLYRNVSCPRSKEGCTQSIPFLSTSRHLRLECGYREVECKWGCEQTIFLHRIERHELQSCRRSLVACPACQESVAAMDLKSHRKRDCSFRPVVCSIGCGEILSFDVMYCHETTVPINQSILVVNYVN